jgi:hypothetical protein
MLVLYFDSALRLNIHMQRTLSNEKCQMSNVKCHMIRQMTNVKRSDPSET